MKKILFYGETTKYAHHGVSISNDLFLADLNPFFDIIVIEEQAKLSSYGKLGVSKVIAYLRSLLQIIKTLRGNQFDYFYHVLSLSLQGGLKSIGLLLFVKLLSPKTQIISHIHRGDFSIKVESNTLLSRLLKLALRLSSKIILISQKQTDDYKSRNYMGINNYFYVPNTVEGSVDYESVRANECKWGRKYLYLSNYIKEKGIHDLLTVWGGFDNTMNLICYGGETPNITVDSLALAYPLSNVKLNKSVFDNKKFDVIGQSKALILPSWNEGAPLVILEAMSLGIPVIASNVGFIREMLGDSYLFLFEAKNKDALKDVILQFDNLSVDELTNLSLELRERFLQYYSRERRIQDYLGVFN
jgi:glycosyltransferase involved in cell wall biosynthesis